ncbi:MAG: hypothetical protein E6R04_06620 [Spirochaetes bacterium]|nr:MAG: hypothetical protein E6R04_06620 [Spirochaetota bacterium]
MIDNATAAGAAVATLQAHIPIHRKAVSDDMYPKSHAMYTPNGAATATDTPIIRADSVFNVHSCSRIFQ